MSSRSERRAAPGIGVQYNHDIDVSPQFAESFVLVGGLLRRPVVIALFKEYDRIARRSKLWFHALGATSVLLGTCALLGVSGRLFGYAVGQQMSHGWSLGISWLALSGVFLAVVSSGAHCRQKYLLASFIRERIRQWHFQSFLDGAFVERVVRSGCGWPTELDQRAQLFVQSIRTTDGAMGDFVLRPGVATRLLHDDCLYTDDAIASEVMTALRVLRVEHQAQYAQRKLAPLQSDRFMTVNRHRAWSGSLAQAAFVLAVVVPVLELLGVWRVWSVEAAPPTWWVPALSSLALAFATLSAAARVYQAGFAVPSEVESYNEYAAEIDQVRALFDDSTSSLEKKREALRALEMGSAWELKRFLAMQQRATFMW